MLMHVLPTVLVIPLVALVVVAVLYLRGDVTGWLASSRLAGDGDAETAANLVLGSVIAAGSLAGAVWAWSSPSVRWAFLAIAGSTSGVAVRARRER